MAKRALLDGSGARAGYQRAQRWPEQKGAMIAWGRTLEAALSDTPPAENVVALRAAGA